MSSFVQVPDSPQDIISSLRFSPVYNHLLAGSWDGDVSLYSTDQEKAQQGTSLLIRINSGSAVTGIAWDQSGRRAFLSNVEGSIKELDLENGKAVNTIGETHQLGIQSLVTVPNSQLMISGSWDKSLQYIDLRSNSSVFMRQLPGKVFAMDCTDKTVVVAMSERQVHVYDVRNAQQPLQIRESGLKYQTRALKCMPNGEGYAQSSIEGRVAIEYFDPTPIVQEKKYAFKCHRLSATDMDLVSPVNALAFHQRYGTLFTGGSDSYVCLWDHEAKKRLRQYSKLDQSVVSLDFDGRNDILAIGTSDDTFKTSATLQETHHHRPLRSQISLRYMSSSEGAPKKKT